MPANIILNIAFPSGTNLAQNGVTNATGWYVKNEGGITTNIFGGSYPNFLLTVQKNPSFYFETVVSGVGPAASGTKLNFRHGYSTNSATFRFDTYIGTLRTIDYYQFSGISAVSGSYDVGSGSWTFTGTGQDGWWSSRVICSGTRDGIYFKVGSANTFSIAPNASGKALIDNWNNRYKFQVDKSSGASGLVHISNIYYGKRTYSTGPVFTDIHPDVPFNTTGGVFNGGGVGSGNPGSGNYNNNGTYGTTDFQTNIQPDPPVDGVVTVGFLPTTMNSIQSLVRTLQEPAEPTDPEVPDEG